MFKKSCVQRISAIITAIGMVMTITSYNIAAASEVGIDDAKSVNNDNALIGYESNANNLLEDYDEDSELCQKLEIDYENSTTDLSEEREKELNSIGVFDSDIEAWDDEMVEGIDNAYAYSMSVMYYGEDTKDGTLEELSPAETDEVINDTYEEELKEVAGDGNILEQALENTVFGAVKAKAKTASKNTISASGKVKQIIAFIQEKKGSDVLVTYSCIWLEDPKCKKTDILAISLKNADCDTSTFKAYRSCHYNDYRSVQYKKSKNYYIDNYCNGSPYGMAAKYEFFDAKGILYRNQTFVLSFRCKKTANKISAWGKCFHCKSNVNVSFSKNIGVNISPKEISLSSSVGVSVSPSDVYSQITNNPTCDFFPK